MIVTDSEDRQPSERATAYLQACLDLLWLNQWKVFLEQSDDPDGNGECDGVCYPDQTYLSARIVIKSGLDERREQEVIMHECLHLTFARVSQAMDTVIGMLPKEKQQILAHTLWHHAEEESVEHLTRALLAQIKPA